MIAYRDLKGSDRNENFRSNSISIGVGIQESLSFLRVWAQGPDDFPEVTNPDNLMVYPHLTAIVDVKDGVVQGITWDDACVFCSGFKCDQVTYDYNGVLQDRDSAGQPTGGCGITYPECNAKHQNDGTDCDIVLYVVWTGSDVDGKALLSSAYRFSAFPAQEIADRLTQNLPGAVKDAGSENTNRDL